MTWEKLFLKPLMYYNRFLGRWVVDPVDALLLSLLLGSLVGSSVKKYLTEEAKNERLKQSLIKKSRLIENKSSSSKLFFPARRRKQAKLQRIYNLASSWRGGENEDLYFKLANKIQSYFLGFALLLYENERNKNNSELLRFLFHSSKVVLCWILSRYNITLFFFIDPLTERVGVTALIKIMSGVGFTTGFFSSWIAATATVLSPVTILTFFALRSVGQQSRHESEFQEVLDKVRKLIDDVETGRLKNPFLEMDKDKPRRPPIELKPLNWDSNPAIREAAEQLGIFEEPIPNGPLKLDTLDPENPIVQKIKEEVNLLDESTNKVLDRKKRVKAKSNNLQNLLKDYLEDDFGSDPDSDLDIIDAEIIKTDPLRVRIDD